LLYNALTYRHCAANEWARSLARFDSILFYFRNGEYATRLITVMSGVQIASGPSFLTARDCSLYAQTFTYGDDALIVGFYYDLNKARCFFPSFSQPLLPAVCVNLETGRPVRDDGTTMRLPSDHMSLQLLQMLHQRAKKSSLRAQSH